MKLYLKYLSVHIRAQMQYKASFALLVFGQSMLALSMFLGIYFLFSRFHRVDGFAYPEVLLCFSVSLMSFSLAECFFRGFDGFYSVISDGTFDRILVRPRGVVFQVLCSRFELSRVGRFLPAAAALAYAVPNAGVQWTAFRVFILFLMVLGQTVVFSCLFLIYAAFCFFTVEGLEFMNIFTDGGRELASYPISIYGKGVLKFYTFAVPLALSQYYPLLYLTARSVSLLYAFCPLLSLAFIAPSLAFWRFGLRHYKSTGS